MNNNVDLTKILKYCPKGTKLYSTIFGEVEFIECDDLYQIIVAKENKYYYFTSQGAFYFERIKYHVGECALFPSKDQRDWSKFTAPWYKQEAKDTKEKFDPKTLQPFDRVLGCLVDSYWKCDIFSNIIETAYLPYKCSGDSYIRCIPYNDETKHLVGTTDAAPDFYRYWE